MLSATARIPGWRVRDVADALAIVALAVAAQVETWWPGELAGSRMVGAVGAVAMTLPFLWRRRFPLAVALVVLSALALQAAAGVGMDDRLFVLVSVLLAMYSVGAYASAGRARLGLAGGAVAIVAPELIGGAVNLGAEDAFYVAVTVGTPWVFGRLVAARQARADQFAALAVELDLRRDELAQHAVAEERERIARDIHDVVAHTVSLMLVQATGGRRRLHDGDAAAAEGALASIETTGRQALADLRRVIALMRDSSDTAALGPQPGLSALPQLVERARAADVDVALDVRGPSRPLTPGLDLTAFRITQEAITNVVKHAPGATAEVVVCFRAHELEIDVRNGAGSATPAGSVLPGGHGLIGMRERASVYGGRLDAGPVDGGGFRVRAWLPFEESVRA